MSMQAFIESMSQHKKVMSERYNRVCMSPGECEEFTRLEKTILMAVMTEEWCPDCLMNLPILARIADAAPRMELRIFIRKDWPELRAYYTTLNNHSIPVATFMDEHFNVLSHWVERPQAAHARLDAWKAAHPEIEEIRRRFDLTSEQKRAMLREINERLLIEMESWYDGGLQSETDREVWELLGLKL
jgi:thiol-disulfide isomerase/thioredoxin